MLFSSQQLTMSICDQFFGLPERLGYVHCNLCTTILLVSVPCSTLLKMVTVRCGHCAGLLSVSLPQSTATKTSVELPLKELSGVDPPPRDSDESSEDDKEKEVAENRIPAVNKPPEKRQRTPSAYNCFIKEEIRRIKAKDPNITHKEAFSTAAKNWAHFPKIQQKRN